MAFTPTVTFPLPTTPKSAYTKLWTRQLDSDNTSDDAEIFKQGIRKRDNDVCVVCGFGGLPTALSECLIIPDKTQWEYMRYLHYIPSNAKPFRHDPRNGLMLCLNHAYAFERYLFYIRWNSKTDEFYVVNHSQISKVSESVHGNVLDFKTSTTENCPYPTAFLWHEYRARGYYPACSDRLVTFKRGAERGGRCVPQNAGIGNNVHDAGTVADRGGLIDYDIYDQRVTELGSPGFSAWIIEKANTQARLARSEMIVCESCGAENEERWYNLAERRNTVNTCALQ